MKKKVRTYRVGEESFERGEGEADGMHQLDSLGGVRWRLRQQRGLNRRQQLLGGHHGCRVEEGEQRSERGINGGKNPNSFQGFSLSDAVTRHYGRANANLVRFSISNIFTFTRTTCVTHVACHFYKSRI